MEGVEDFDNIVELVEEHWLVSDLPHFFDGRDRLVHLHQASVWSFGSTSVLPHRIVISVDVSNVHARTAEPSVVLATPFDSIELGR